MQEPRLAECTEQTLVKDSCAKVEVSQVLML